MSSAHEPRGGVTYEPTAAVPQWSWLQKLCFRLIFTIGGGMIAFVGGLVLLVTICVNVVRNSAGRYPFEPVVWLFAQIGSYLSRGRGVEITKSAGSDQLWIWCFHLGWFAVGLLITALWTTMDRRRSHYRRLAASLIVFGRFGLALVMILYGMGKVFPVQMGFMAMPDHQLQLVGDTSLFQTLWGFMGASEPYTVMTGIIEVGSGVLLLWRRTWLLGALGSVIAMTQVFLLNMSYDVPVKLAVGELLVVAIGITMPYWSNLTRVMFNRGSTYPVKHWLPLGADRSWLLHTGLVAKFGIAAIVLMLCVKEGAIIYAAYHTPSSTLDGVWRTTSFTIEGRQAMLNQANPQPWVNVAIADRNEVPAVGVVRFVSQTPDGYTTTWLLKIDGDRLELHTRQTDPAQIVLRAAQPDKDRLILTGTLEGRQFEGMFERRFMERSRYGFRLISPPVLLDSVR